MYKKGIVVKVEGNQVTVLPFVKDACASCSQNCKERGESYTVANPQNLKVEKGTVVGITAEKKMEALQGLISLLLPFLCAVLGFMLSPAVAKVFSLPLSEGTKALCTLSFLLISSALVLLITRKVPLPGQNQIVEVY